LGSQNTKQLKEPPAAAAAVRGKEVQKKGHVKSYSSLD